jgi:trk system potassium uptake protein TrkA
VRRLNVVIVGAGEVGTSILEALHGEHDVRVIDNDADRIREVGLRYGCTTLHGDASSRRLLTEAGLDAADLIITCTTRDEVNIVAALFARRLSRAMTVVRVANPEYLDVWRAGEFEFDFMVSPPLETAHAITRLIGVPAARQTDLFADGRVQMVEFDVPETHPPDTVVGVALNRARLPADSKVASIIRGQSLIIARGSDVIRPGDRIVVIGSPESARAWSRLVEGKPRIDSVAVIGSRKSGAEAARALGARGVHVRVVESDPARARTLAESAPNVRVVYGDGADPDVLQREQIGGYDAVVCALQDDADNLLVATVARQLGVKLVIAIVSRPRMIPLFEVAGVDVALNPQDVTAAEIVRFTRDPRTQAMAILEGGGAEVLEIEVRGESRLVGVPFRELPVTDSSIGAIVRGDDVIFPHGDDHLEGGDRVVIFTRAGRVDAIEQAL